MRQSKSRGRNRVNQSAAKRDLGDLSRTMEAALREIDFSPLRALEGAPPNWYFAREGTEDEANAIVAAVEQVIGHSPLLKRQQRAFSSIIDAFIDSLSPEHFKLWLSVDVALNARGDVEKALFYNLGVEDGRTMKATEVALASVGANVHASEPTDLFKMAMVLREMAQELEWRSSSG